MDSNINRGQLKRWNDDKGFGFIKPDIDSKDVFLHISELKGMGRRPLVGDIIFYNIHADKNGKIRAFNARIDGVDKVRSLSPKKRSNRQNNSHWFIKLLILVGLSVAIFFYYSQKTEVAIGTGSPYSSVPKKSNSTYICSGKKHCSEMTSCEEATFYQNNCPGTKMDGDRDGVPCESQWCTW